MSLQPKFAIVVHDGNFETFSQPEGALNLIEDDNLHEFIPVEITNQLKEEEYTTTAAGNPFKLIKNPKNCCLL